MTAAGTIPKSNPTSTPAQTPGEVLDALQMTLRTNQAQANRLNNEADMLHDDVAGLQGELDAVEPAVTAYDAANLPRVQSELVGSLDDLKTCVTAVLGEKAKAAQAVVDGLENDSETAAKDKVEAQQAHDEAAADVEVKTANVDHRHKAWDDLIALADRRTGELAELSALRDQAAEANSNTFGAYARISEAQRRLTLVGDAPSTKEYRATLMTAWQDLATAREALRTARLHLVEKELDLTTKTAILEALTADRVTVLEYLWRNRPDAPSGSHDAPSPPASPPAPAGTPPAPAGTPPAPAGTPPAPAGTPPASSASPGPSDTPGTES